MELARISSKGQITIPKEVRKKLNLKEGDKVLFIEEDGKVVIQMHHTWHLKKYSKL